MFHIITDLGVSLAYFSLPLCLSRSDLLKAFIINKAFCHLLGLLNIDNQRQGRGWLQCNNFRSSRERRVVQSIYCFMGGNPGVRRLRESKRFLNLSQVFQLFVFFFLAASLPTLVIDPGIGEAVSEKTCKGCPLYCWNSLFLRIIIIICAICPSFGLLALATFS